MNLARPSEHSASPAGRSRARARNVLATAAVTALACGAVVIPLTSAHAADTNLSQGKTATASSSENDGVFGAKAAVDGDTGTRWSSTFSDGQWLQVDLGQVSTITRVDLQWEAAYADAFQILVSNDGTTWTTAKTVTGGTGGKQSVTVSATGRYVRMLTTHRATTYGVSLWELQVFGTAGTSTPTPTPTPTSTPTSTPTGACGTTNVALGKAATASSTENAGTPASAAVDGDAGTRWSSAFTDAQWLQVDLGSSQNVCGVELDWEGAYGKAFQVQTSADGSTWTTVYSTTTGTGGTQKLTVSGTGRYVRVLGSARGTQYGYSLWELKVFTTSGSTSSPTSTPTQTPTSTPTPTPTSTGNPIPGGGSLGSNVHIFTPSDSAASIQSTLDSVFSRQETNQFGDERDLLLFAPGSYDVKANVGFYTSVAGLGKNPDDVNINGGVWVDAGWFDGNATQNFWRSVENLSITPQGYPERWAVAQAAPMRRVHVKGDLSVYPSSYGWASGGFIADSKVDGTVSTASQQQWFSRSSTFGGWSGSVWNMVFAGVQGAPSDAAYPNPPFTTVATQPVDVEKPYLYMSGSATTDLAVWVPSKQTSTSGVTWPNTPGRSVPISQFYVAHPGDTTAKINQALAQGLNLMFTPGVYHLDGTIAVNNPDTVVLGLGLATLIPDKNASAMTVADVNGVSVSGLLFDAGTAGSPSLLRVGTAGSHADHAADPISIHDIFTRVGGVVPGKTGTAIEIDADDTVVDHVWSWRADHGAGVGWTANTADYGFVVNGNDVTAYGLFVEHYQKYNVLWNGNGGKTYFYQSELAYDVPNQAAWQNGSTRGYAGYKVASTVTTHEAWGLGVYCYFNVDPTITVDRAIEVPDVPGVKIHHAASVSLGGNGSIQHVVNNTGGIAQGTATVPSYVTQYGG
ncbi:discoidin domain-containing protein [Luteimicrobium subarcticum]|uniref:F5/8 type C domain-containing protein n=1 Tax=Luteimicrobium subarcticum TaxID=620910 RepID=A0A2M8WVX7_9MICO|nr:discoidin domain-containing protein [Luteimicrobium subarcticum]PJI95070.1 F5/8 type C domain-containing protein [Luteimicrobium subarcticum]